MTAASGVGEQATEEQATEEQATEEQSAEQRRLGRPRDPQADRAILEAALEELRLNGFGGFTVDAVATRAGVGKATIYRRWPSREDLIFSAASCVVEAQRDPDTGTLRDDLVTFFAASYRAKASAPASAGRGLFAAIAAEASVNPELERMLHTFLDQRRDVTRQITNRAVARGELAADVDRDLLIDLIAGPVFYRSAMTQRGVDDALIGKIVDTVLRGLGAGEAPKSTGRAKRR